MEKCDCGWLYPAGFAITPPGLPVQGLAIQCPQCKEWVSSGASMEIARGVSFDELQDKTKGKSH